MYQNNRVQAARALARSKAAIAYNTLYATRCRELAPLAEAGDFVLAQINDECAAVALAAKEIAYLQMGYVPCTTPGCTRLATPGYSVCRPCEESGRSMVTLNGVQMPMGL